MVLRNLVQLILGTVLLVSCARGPVKDSSEALRPTKQAVTVVDDLKLSSLVEGLIQSITQLEKKPDRVMRFGQRKILRREYAQSLRSILQKVEEANSKQEIYDFIQQNFELHEVYGKEKWGEVFVTSYYDPVIKGLKYPKEPFTQPIYKTPKDMVKIDLDAYSQRFPKWKVFSDDVLEQKSRKSIVRGRIDRAKKIPTITPYFDRQEIDEGLVLNNRSLELAYVKPVDSFFLQIQGSGIVKMRDGKEMPVGYDSQNGHPYVAIGKFLLDKIPLEQMSLQKIEDHLATLEPDEQQAILNQNPSYVFFRKLKGPSQTYFSTDVVPGRTIATDYSMFPKGAMVLIEFPKPVFANNKATAPLYFETTKRLVFDHDTGGAIRGPARLDLYWGKGESAKQHAGIMRHWGKMFYLFPKSL